MPDHNIDLLVKKVCNTVVSVELSNGENNKPIIIDSFSQETIKITVNKNLAKINETDWTLTENNTIKNKAKNGGSVLAEFHLKEGQTITEEQADRLLRAELDGTCEYVKKYCSYN